MTKQITHFKLTNKNKQGKQMTHIKLLAVDTEGKEHYLKFVNTEFACDLIDCAKPGELVDDIQ